MADDDLAILAGVIAIGAAIFFAIVIFPAIVRLVLV
jgi:hypothetical protein